MGFGYKIGWNEKKPFFCSTNIIALMLDGAIVKLKVHLKCCPIFFVRTPFVCFDIVDFGIADTNDPIALWIFNNCSFLYKSAHCQNPNPLDLQVLLSPHFHFFRRDRELPKDTSLNYVFFYYFFSAECSKIYKCKCTSNFVKMQHQNFFIDSYNPIFDFYSLFFLDFPDKYDNFHWTFFSNVSLLHKSTSNILRPT